MEKKETSMEHIARLTSHPNHISSKEEREKFFAEKGRQLAADEELMLGELRATGLILDSVWDLVNRKGDYPAAVPILIKHLQEPHLDRILEGIGRALAVPSVKGHWSLLVSRYKAAAGSGEKAGLAISLAATCRASVLDEMLDLLRDPANGSSRVILVHAFRRSRHPKVVQTIDALRTDPDLVREIASWKKK